MRKKFDGKLMGKFPFDRKFFHKNGKFFLSKWEIFPSKWEISHQNQKKILILWIRKNFLKDKLNILWNKFTKNTEKLPENNQHITQKIKYKKRQQNFAYQAKEKKITEKKLFSKKNFPSFKFFFFLLSISAMKSVAKLRGSTYNYV